jgi:ERCC4-type nuclease
MTPTILQDSREQSPLVFTAYPTEVATLSAGDYGIKGFSDWGNPQFIIERKSLNDLIGSLTFGRERFWKELEKLRQFRFAAVVVEAERRDIENHVYRSAATPESVFQSLTAIMVRCNVHVVFCGDAGGAARMVERLVRQFVRGIEKDAERLGMKLVEKPQRRKAVEVSA